MQRSIHWHPVVLAVYPVLHLLAHNIDAVRSRAALEPLVLAAVASLVLWLMCSLVLRSRGKGALLTALTAVLFFSHGHLLGLVAGGATVAWIMLFTGIVVFTAAGILLARWRGDPRPWNRILDVAALVLAVMVLVPIVRSELQPPTNLPGSGRESAVQASLGYLPDIYVIILDAFGRADQLAEIYDVDLSELQAFLESRGFVVAERARANYCQTSLSLAALLNSEYIQTLIPSISPDRWERQDLNSLVRENRNLRRLRDMGYRLITLTGGSELTEQADPDVDYRGGTLNEFQAGLMGTTPLPLIATLLGSTGRERLNPFAQHRQTVRFQLAKLPHVMVAGGPKLVFAHIMTPHPPFVIGAGGEELMPGHKFSLRERDAWRGYVQGYAGQAIWLAGVLQKTVEGILTNCRRRPVILIMGDHGPASRWVTSWRRTKSFDTDDPDVITERMSIFLALLLPPGEGGELYPELTPVNVFPLVFERCFGEKAVLRPDRSFFSTYKNWSTFTDVDSLGRSSRAEN